jgi:hypothetical protein
VLPDAQKITETQLCGKKDCVPNGLGSPFSFTKKTHTVDITNTSTEKDIALQVLGHTIKTGDFWGGFAPSCATTSKNPFTKTDITRLSSSGRTIDYVRTETLELKGGIEGAVQANLEEIKKYTADQLIINELEAKIKAEYTKLNGKSLTITGKYSEWGLNKTTVDKLVKGDGFVDCREYLKNNNKRIITTVGIVYYDITFTSESLNKIASEIQAFAEGKGISANLSFTFKREVSQDLEASTEDYYQILTWRHAGVNSLENM